jgi:hypothetical protein
VSPRPNRITTTWGKWAFAFATVVVVLGVGLAIASVAPDLAVTAVLILVAAAIVLGARMFRVPGEPVDAPRPWWKATGRTTLSLVLGIVAFIFLPNQLLPLLFASVTEQPGEPITYSAPAFTLLFAAFYLHSGIRQVFSGPATQTPAA